MERCPCGDGRLRDLGAVPRTEGLRDPDCSGDSEERGPDRSENGPKDRCSMHPFSKDACSIYRSDGFGLWSGHAPENVRASSSPARRPGPNEQRTFRRHQVSPDGARHPDVLRPAGAAGGAGHPAAPRSGLRARARSAADHDQVEDSVSTAFMGLSARPASRLEAVRRRLPLPQRHGHSSPAAPRLPGANVRRWPRPAARAGTASPPSR